MRPTYTSYRRRAVGAARRLDRDRRRAVWALPRARSRRGSRDLDAALDPVDLLHQYEYRQRHDQEVEHLVDELAVGDDRNGFRLGVGERHGDALRRVEHV